MECQDRTSIWGTAASMYQHGLSRAFFAEKAATTAHREYATMTGFGTYAKAPQDIVRSIDYVDSLPQL